MYCVQNLKLAIINSFHIGRTPLRFLFAHNQRSGLLSDPKKSEKGSREECSMGRSLARVRFSVLNTFKYLMRKLAAFLEKRISVASWVVQINSNGKPFRVFFHLQNFSAILSPYISRTLVCTHPKIYFSYIVCMSDN